MHDDPTTLQSKIDHTLKAFPKGIDDEALLNDSIGILHEDRIDEGRQVFKMIIEGIAVDAAVLHDILDGDFVNRPILQQTEAGIHNGFTRK